MAAQDQSLHTLLELNERQRDQARAAVLQAEEMGRRLLAQQQQLVDYRGEQQQRHPSVDGRPTTIDALRHHTQFMQRLDQAMQHLQGQLRQHDHQLTRLRNELLAREMRLASVRKLLERRGKDAQRKADRQEQRNTDDAAQRQLQRQRSGADSGWH